MTNPQMPEMPEVKDFFDLFGGLAAMRMYVERLQPENEREENDRCGFLERLARVEEIVHQIEDPDLTMFTAVRFFKRALYGLHNPDSLSGEERMSRLELISLCVDIEADFGREIP